MSQELEEHAAAAPGSSQEASKAATSPRAVSRSESGDLSGIRLGFLYNHDALHQVAHSAPIIGQLAALHPEL